MLPSGSPKARALSPRLADVPEAAELSGEQGPDLPSSLLQDLLHLSASDSPHDPLMGPAAGSVPVQGRLGGIGGGGIGGSPPATAVSGPSTGQQQQQQQQTSPPREGKVKRFIVSMKTAGPAFLQRQLEGQPSVVAAKSEARYGGAAQPHLTHALTESPAVIRQYAE